MEKVARLLLLTVLLTMTTMVGCTATPIHLPGTTDGNGATNGKHYDAAMAADAGAADTYVMPDMGAAPSPDTDGPGGDGMSMPDGMPWIGDGGVPPGDLMLLDGFPLEAGRPDAGYPDAGYSDSGITDAVIIEDAWPMEAGQTDLAISLD